MLQLARRLRDGDDVPPGSPPAAGLLDRLDRRTAWLVALVAVAGFAAARAIDVLMLLQAVHQHPGVTMSDYLTVWDGGWYQKIAAHGYPHELMRSHRTGYVIQTALAFYPAFPGLVRGLQEVSPLSFAQAGVALNLVFGAAAAVLIALLLRHRLGPVVATAVSVLWSFVPASPVLMLTYTEALFCLELVAFLGLLQRRRYVWLAVLMPVIGLTRGALLPLAAVLLVHLAVRWRAGAAASSEPAGSRWRVTWTVGGLLAVLLASFALWPAWVGLRTGQRDAYLQIQRAWIRDQATTGSWRQGIGLLAHGHLQSNTAGVRDHGLVATVGLVLVLLALLAVLTPLTAELKVLAPAYLLFFIVLTPAWSSFFRYMVPIFTLTVPVAMVLRPRWWPARLAGAGVILAVLVAFVAGQHWWIEHFVVPFPGGVLHARGLTP